jgi:hypothetical protein
MVALQCPHCLYYANFTTRYAREPEGFGPAVGLLTCDQCDKPIAALVDSFGDLKEYWPEVKLKPKSFPDVPPHIAATATEACLCLGSGAPRGAVALARAVVEAVAKNKGIRKGNLESKIDAMHGAGHISEAMREAAHEVRFAGNEAAHGDLVSEPLTEENAEEIVALMSTILQRVYQEPARVARIREQREERKRKQEEEEKELAAQFSDEPPF